MAHKTKDVLFWFVLLALSARSIILQFFYFLIYLMFSSQFLHCLVALKSFLSPEEVIRNWRKEFFPTKSSILFILTKVYMIINQMHTHIIQIY